MADRRLSTTLTTIYVAKLGLNTGARFVYPFLPAIARGLGVSLEAAGLLISARWLAGLATPVVVRIAAPGEQRRRLALIGLGLGAVGAAVTTAGAFGLALAGFVLMGVGKPVADVAFQAYIADEVPYHERARAISFSELAWGSALLIGAPIAGWLLATWGWKTPFGAIAIATALLMWPLYHLLGVGSHEHDATIERSPLGLDRSKVAFLAATGAFTFAAEISFVVFGAWLEDAFDVSLVALGTTAVFIAVGELLGEGASVGWTDRIGKRTAVVTGLALSAVGYLIVPFTGTYLVAVLAFTIALGGFEVAIVSSIPLATEQAPRARARFLALMVMNMGIFRAVGSAVGVPIYTSLGLVANMVIAAVANGVAIVLMLSWVREESARSERPAA
jgi:predicted MFS family arabinose efflux permease